MRGARLSLIIEERRGTCIKKKGREKCCDNGDACDNYVGVFILFCSLLPFFQK